MMRLEYNTVYIISSEATLMDDACPRERPALSLPELEAQITELAGDKDTATTLWRGERMDYGLAIEELLQQARGARGVSAETPEIGNAG